jgi:hypothetical protein
MGFLRADAEAGVLAAIDRRRRGGPDGHRGDERPDLPTARERARRPLQRGPLQQPYRRSRRHAPHAPPELVLARPAAGWRCDRPGSGRAPKWSTRSRAPAVEEPRGDGVRGRITATPSPDRAFAGTLVWSYEVEPDGEGTLLTSPTGHATRRPDRLARHRAALRRARPEIRPPRHRESLDALRRGQRPSTGTGSVDDHRVMVIFAGRRRGGAPLGQAFRAADPELPA